MTFVLPSLILIWICGLLFLAGLLLNDVRLLYNNIIPGAARTSNPPLRDRRFGRAVGWFPPTPEWISLGIASVLIGHIFKIDRAGGSPLTGIDPAALNETGRLHLKKTMRHEWITLAWMVVGLALITWIF